MTRENSKQTDNPLLEHTNAYEDIVFMKDCIDAVLVNESFPTQAVSQTYKSGLLTNK
ncbi:hypothetical protein ABEX78_20995 [Priestia megaterium]